METAGIDPQTVLRMLCGLWFLPHIAGKLLNAQLASGTFEKVGLKPGRLFLYATVAMELLAAFGLVFGIYPRVAAALAVFVLAGASYAVLRMHGFNWRWNRQGPEYMVFWSIVCVLAVW
ncbi:MAG: DoxX family protein [Sphingomonadaceae bacterium]|nr:DoxX family protein [Sphingomonadaceae bacterium]